MKNAPDIKDNSPDTSYYVMIIIKYNFIFKVPQDQAIQILKVLIYFSELNVFIWRGLTWVLSGNKMNSGLLLCEEGVDFFEYISSYKTNVPTLLYFFQTFHLNPNHRDQIPHHDDVWEMILTSMIDITDSCSSENLQVHVLTSCRRQWNLHLYLPDTHLRHWIFSCLQLILLKVFHPHTCGDTISDHQGSS